MFFRRKQKAFATFVITFGLSVVFTFAFPLSCVLVIEGILLIVVGVFLLKCRC